MLKLKNIDSMIVAGAMLIGVAAAFFGCNSSDSFRGSEMPADMPVMDFTLTDQHGEPFTLSEHRGKIVLIFFGYTFCPDVCPMTLSTWQRVETALGADAEQVEFVYITVDPKRDTPEKLKDHISIFSDEFVGLTGSEEEMETVYADFGVFRSGQSVSNSGTGYLMSHTSRIFALDKQGKWRVGIDYDAAVEDIVHDVRLLLASD